MTTDVQSGGTVQGMVRAESSGDGELMPAGTTGGSGATPAAVAKTETSPGRAVDVEAPDVFEKLDARQCLALQALIEGQNASAAARAAGVSRQTLYRWQQGHPYFVAAYNAWQRQALDSARGRLIAMADKAVTALETSMFSGDGRVPMTVLRILGALVEVKPGTADGPGLARAWRWQENPEPKPQPLPPQSQAQQPPVVEAKPPPTSRDHTSNVEQYLAAAQAKAR